MRLGRDRYRLELHWSDVIYEREGVAKLSGAYFSGPALKISQKLNDKDEINIDMTNQYVIFVPNFYIAKLKWDGIEYTATSVKLKTAIIENKFVNSIPQLKKNDYFVIDTFKHEEQTHAFHLNYDCYLVDELDELYKF